MINKLSKALKKNDIAFEIREGKIKQVWVDFKYNVKAKFILSSLPEWIGSKYIYEDKQPFKLES